MLPTLVFVVFFGSCISVIASVILIVWERKQYGLLRISEIERPISKNLSNCIIMLAIAGVCAQCSVKCAKRLFRHKSDKFTFLQILLVVLDLVFP